MGYQEPSSMNNSPETPTWVWVLGGLAILTICCVVFSVGTVIVLSMLGPTIEQTFEQTLQTIEASTPVFEGITPSANNNEDEEEPTPAGVATVGSPNKEVGEPSFVENFNREGYWAVGTVYSDPEETILEAEAVVENGVFMYSLPLPQLMYWSTAGEQFGDGLYQLEATAIDGPENNGYGLLFMVDNDTDDFYIFEISSDGYAWIGLYRDGGSEDVTSLVGDGWIETSAVKTGLNATNVLKVEANKGLLTFWVNDEEVAQVEDNTFSSGDVAVFAETFEEGGVVIEFDNFSFTPLD